MHAAAGRAADVGIFAGTFKGGTHSDVVAPNIPRIVEFFSQHQRTAK